MSATPRFLAFVSLCLAACPTPPDDPAALRFERQSLVGAACSFNDQCELGEYCDSATRTCMSECSISSPCSDTTRVCSEAGRCVDPSELGAGPGRLRVSPASFALSLQGEHGAPPARRVTLSVSTFTDASQAVLRVVARRGLEVACVNGSDSAPAEGYASECRIARWAFTPSPSGEARATNEVWVRASSEARAEDDGWSIDLASADLVASVRTVTVSHLRLPPPQALEGEYAGEVLLHRETDEFELTSSDTEPMHVFAGYGQDTDEPPTTQLRVAVTAVVNAKGMVLIDASRQLSWSGRLFYARLGQAPSASGIEWEDEVNIDARAASPLEADALANTGAIFLRTIHNYDALLRGDRLSGTFAVLNAQGVGALETWSFDLRRTGASSRASCASDAECAADEACEARAGVCVRGPKTNQQIYYMDHKRHERWSEATSEALRQAMIDSAWDPPASGDYVAWTNVSIMPPARFAELRACYDPALVSDANFFDSARFGAEVLPLSGELVCATGMVPSAIPLSTYRDLHDPLAQEIPAAEMFEICMRELRSLPVSTASDAKSRLRELLQNTARCVNWGRLAWMLPSNAWPMAAYQKNIVRQWINLHSFVAEQGLLQWQSANAMAATSDAAGDYRKLEELLSQIERGWDLVVLTTNLTDPLLQDYREPYVGPSSRPGQEQSIPLPIAIEEGLSRQLRVLEAYIAVAGRLFYPWCGSPHQEIDERIGAMLRYAAMADSLAARLRTLGDPQKSAPWSMQWDAARAEARSTRQRLMRQFSNLRACDNPLGLSEDDLPLYFADPSASSGRFFASSDYLMSLARPAVQAATNALEDARAAWARAKESKIQDVVSALEHERRVEQLQAKYGEQIMAACGLSGIESKDVLAAFAPVGALYPSSCHIDLPRADCARDPRSVCFRGALGLAALDMRAAGQDVDIARAQLATAEDICDRQWSYCQQLAEDLESDSALNRLRASYVEKRALQKLAADEAALVMNELITCGQLEITAIGNPELGEKTTTLCAFAALKLKAQFGASRRGWEIQEMEREHAQLMQEARDRRTAAACFHETDATCAPVPALLKQIERRKIDFQAAEVRFNDLREHVAQQLFEGRAAAQRERARTLPTVGHHYWQDEKVSAFQREIDRARMLAFLAEQAVEYDHQQSLPLRRDVVRATRPDELARVLDLLGSYHDTRLVSGARPEGSTIILSLRDEVLNLDVNRATGEALPEGAANLRLRRRLSDPEAALYDASGSYVGQAIRFTLPPSLQALRSRCAERLWSVSASIVNESPSAGVCPLRLIKRSVFESKWCREEDGASTQVGRLSPSLTLFGLQAESPSAGAWGDEAMSEAFLWAPSNRSREDLLREPQGASSELAGQGLYGDYMLLFPRSDTPGCTEIANETLFDVLLRFDSYSAATRRL